MAVAPTGAIYKALKFDNVSSRTYGVYITGEAVYNAPERDVEMITIPGRSGSFALDNGRFENIEVAYPAGIYADTEADFRQAISDFRNFLCSRNGYVRLQDEYNPDEYRMAVYKSGLEVTPAMLKAGEFNIVFDCKPQRWLTSGETAVAVTSGDTLTNPTLFESSPLLEIEGSGSTVRFNGYSINIPIKTYGTMTITGSNTTSEIRFRQYYTNVGDAIAFNTVSSTYEFISNATFQIVGTTVSVTDSNAGYSSTAVIQNGKIIVTTIIPSVSFTANTSSTAVTGSTNTTTISFTAKRIADGTEFSSTATIVRDINYTGAYNATQSNISISTYITSTRAAVGNRSYSKELSAVIDSTASIWGSPSYVDCSIGDVYTYKLGVLENLNAYVNLGAELPTLASGSNTVTVVGGGITSLKIVPRWWKV